MTVTFGYRPVGTTAWQRLGSDDNAPYRVFQDVSGLPKGTPCSSTGPYCKDASGNYSVSGSYGVVGDAPAPGGGGGGGASSYSPPTSVCPVTTTVRWAARRLVAGLRPGAADAGPEGQGLEGHLHRSRPVSTPTRPRSTRRGTRTTVPAATRTAPTSPTRRPAHTGDVLLRARPALRHVECRGADHHRARHLPEGAGLCGRLGPGLHATLADRPGRDGTYTWSTSEIGAGSYEAKVAHNLSWDESYPANNIPITVPADGLVVTFSYVLATHVLTVTTSTPGAQPDLSQAKAYWLTKDLLAVPAVAHPERSRWRLHWSTTARSRSTRTTSAARPACATTRPGYQPPYWPSSPLWGTRRSDSTTAMPGRS